MRERFEPHCEDGGTERDRTTRQVVSACARLLSQISSDELFRFLHSLHIQFSLTCQGKKFHCRLYQHEYGDDGNLRNVRQFTSTGEAPQFALRNAIAEFLVRSPEDYHCFVGATRKRQ